MGGAEILDRLRAHGGTPRIAIECYPGVLLEPLRREIAQKLAPEIVLESTAAMLPPAVIESKFASMLGDDLVFGFMIPVVLNEFFDPEKVPLARCAAESASGLLVAIGTGATQLLPS